MENKEVLEPGTTPEENVEKTETKDKKANSNISYELGESIGYCKGVLDATKSKNREIEKEKQLTTCYKHAYFTLIAAVFIAEAFGFGFNIGFNKAKNK